jgi:hypothetical protein
MLREIFQRVLSISSRLTTNLRLLTSTARESATFLLKSASPVRGTLTVFDLSGRVVEMQKLDHNQFIFNSKELQTGCYLFQIASEGQLLAAGKLMVIGN